jgi:hypothetical protein
VFERQSVVVRIEAGLVVAGAKFGAGFELGMTAENFAPIAVAAEVVPVIVTLEHSVVLDDPVVRLAHVGPQDGSGEAAVVVRRQGVSDVVEQGADHGLLVGAVA